MKIEKIMNLNYSNKIHKIILKNELKKTGYFDNNREEVPLLMMQRIVGFLERKYDFKISYKMCYKMWNDTQYGHYWIATIFNGCIVLNVKGNSLYELFVKLCIRINYEIINKRIKERC